jgi:uncharacterized protein GlcG (DUF336 family)
MIKPAFLNSTRGKLFSLICIFGLCPSPLHAAVPMRPILPSKAALRAVDVAVETCRQKGFNVTATVVNAEGVVIAVLRGDDATPHTIEHSYNKAYTSITTGPIFKVDSTGKVYEAFRHQKRAGVGTWPMPAAPIRGISFNIGGLELFANGFLVGGLGVSGTPDGHIDQECAFKGRDAAQNLLQ